MGFGSWLEKKIAGTPSPEKIKREQDLKKELEDIRWKAHVEREKKRARQQSPDRLGRVVDVFGRVGEAGGRMSKGALDVLGGDFDVQVPSGEVEDLGRAPRFSAPSMLDDGFYVGDPLAFGDGVRRRRRRKR